MALLQRPVRTGTTLALTREIYSAIMKKRNIRSEKPLKEKAFCRMEAGALINAIAGIMARCEK